MNWTYEILRSSRRTLALEIRDGRLLVRAPRRATQAEIEALLEKHGAWIEKHLQRAEAQRAAAEALAPLTVEELRALAERALQVIPERVRYYAPKIGVTYGRITIRAQRTKWGSCSAQGNLNFNCLLMLAPPEVLDSIVVHELCHRREMNHSERFYAEVLRVFPDYRKWNKWLKENGPLLMQRLPKPEANMP
ncbi:MAG: M48 family metallopeptidase [Oscillospiraceae bacterium]|jgi:Predicted metal-dependent hydrolase|nr:M48 family metallopeptidase [Oscillospiraceae bacterium]